MTDRPAVGAAASRDDARALLESLPDTLPRDEILAINSSPSDIHTTRTYAYNGWTFVLPPGVFRPGDTSRIIHDRLLDGTIPVAGRSYAAMGAGLGVEAVIAGTLGAREVYAADVHPDSVATATGHYRRIVGDRPGTVFRPLVSNLFEEFPDSARLDVITFNPPAVSTRTSDDPTVVRNVCVGAGIVTRFFDQIVTRDLLAPDGEIHLVVSNTAELRRIVGHAVDAGFRPEVVHHRTWEGDNCRAFLFKLIRRAAA
ncbi:methyltransferase [Streptomyces sp. WAC05374]|uniref:methyltransferase n=1 Tax=Streptomyces sp. WAC05374 TaxID=2487420 RepID=UPI000F8674A9|nr:methyltransferase [Streptomyces sp. WAC05374]RST17694.1 methyltransferase [Streptomyces sp. WAC05374]TDF52695.1 methyltransferase [Streptomyces sp. WAC05374]TDF54114.1 methyltransferase [Streptomyces sp. WAC05374]